MFSSLKNIIISTLVAIGLISAPTVIDYQKQIDSLQQKISDLQEQFGATTKRGETVAFFETALQASISTSATSFTLLKNTDKAGSTLASSTYAFVVDEGEANEEIVIADCFVSGAKTCANAVRGVSPITGTSTVSALQKAHRLGSSVKITDAPILLYLNNVFKGKQFLETPITYGFSSSTLTAGSNQLASIDYVDGVALAGCGDASDTTSGCSELATRTEIASTTSTGGSGKKIVVPASAATSTPGANITSSGGSGETYVVVSEDDGKINQSWLDLSEVFDFTSNLTTTGTFSITGSLFSAKNASTSIFSSLDGLFVGRTSTTTIRGNNLSSTLPYASTTAITATTASTTNLIIDGNGSCEGCINPGNSGNGYQRLTGTCSLNGGSPSSCSVNLTCPTGKSVISGGWDGISGLAIGAVHRLDSYSSATSTWNLEFQGANGATDTMTGYAYCLKN